MRCFKKFVGAHCSYSMDKQCETAKGCPIKTFGSERHLVFVSTFGARLVCYGEMLPRDDRYRGQHRAKRLSRRNPAPPRQWLESHSPLSAPSGIHIGIISGHGLATLHTCDRSADRCQWQKRNRRRAQPSSAPEASPGIGRATDAGIAEVPPPVANSMATVKPE